MPIKQPPHSAGRRLVGLRSAIDPSQIPSAPDVALTDQTIWSQEPFMTCDSQRTIPLALSAYTAVDQGNSSPRFIRATTYAFPHTRDLASSCEVPLGFVIQPFAEQRPEEASIPVIDSGPNGPPRCDQCRAYVNPWCVWTMGGQKWICNLCGTESQVPPEYFSPLDHSGRRVDLGNRPELSRGTVDIIVPKEYWSPQPPPRILPSFSEETLPSHNPGANRIPLPLRTLFIIDVSVSALSSNTTRDACNAIRNILFTKSRPEQTLESENNIGIMTFDSSLHFYDLTPGQSQPSMIVLSDVDDVFAPMQGGSFVPLSTAKHEILATLDLIESQFADSLVDKRASFSAFQCALALMASGGGQVVAFTSEIPNYGPNLITRRNEAALLEAEKLHTLFMPQDEAWSSLGDELAENGIVVDIFFFPKQPVDVATVGSLCTKTGGDIFYHPRYVSERDAHVVQSEVERVWDRELVYDVTVRTRVSSGLRVTSSSGSFIEQLSGDLAFGALDADKAFSVAVDHETSLDTRKDVYVQCAILHTSTSGQRRVRLLNLAVGTASLAHNVFRFADVDATVSLLVREAVDRLPSQNTNTVKEKFTERCASLLLAYRRQCAASTAPTQLILPEAYKLIPVYGLGFLKDLSVRGGSISSDVRNSATQRLRTMGAGALIAHLYPVMFALHNLDPSVGITNETTGWIPLPPYMRPTYMLMESDGVYLADNGILSVLWIGRLVSSQLLKDIFGVDAVDSLSPSTPIQPGSLISNQLSNILYVLENRRGGRKVPFRLARQEMDAAEIEFSNMLVEDQNNDAMSYTDYICHVHKLINAALTSNTGIGGGHFWSGWM